MKSYVCFTLVIPAEFTKALQNQEVKEGESVTLMCEYSIPGVQFVWRKGPETLKSSEKYHMRQRKSCISLTIHNLKPEDSGNYICICRDQRTMASLTVNGIDFDCYENSFIVFIFDLSASLITFPPFQRFLYHLLKSSRIKRQMKVNM